MNMRSNHQNRLTALGILLSLAGLLFPPAPVAAQTWTGAGANVFSGDWNNAVNWSNPSQVPNSATADALFGPSATNTVSVEGIFQVRSLTFASATNNYIFTSPLTVGNKWLTNLQTITVAENVTTTQQISLFGSLLFTGSGPAALTIANNALPTAVVAPTLLIGPFTTIGTPGGGGITVTGTGTTTISGGFAGGGNVVVGGLTKSGPGALSLSGDGTNLNGGLTLAGGTLRLDYSTNSASKLGGGRLTSSGGDLVLVPTASTTITQNVAGTSLSAGHTDIIRGSSGASVTLNLGLISRTPGSTLNFASNVTIGTSSGIINGLLGTGPAFATNRDVAWARSTGGSVADVVGTLNVFGSGINSDVSQSGSFSTTTNSLKFTNDGVILSLVGTRSLQSGGILQPPSALNSIITGGTLTSGTNELIAYVHGIDLTIRSAISVTNSITKTGAGTLTLAGVTFFGLRGPVNINRGDLKITSSLSTFTAINFNDARFGRNLQKFTVDVGDTFNDSTNATIRLSAYSDPNEAEANVFSTGASRNSRITLSGVISSAPGAITPLRFEGQPDGTSGFNLTGANSFTGTVRLIAGTLGINSNLSLGNPTNAILLDRDSTPTSSILEFLNGGIDLARPVSFVITSQVASNGIDVNTISGPVIGDTLVKVGTGTLVLTNAGNSGNRDIRGGTLRVAAGALGTTGDLTMLDGTILAVTGTDTFAATRSFTLVSSPGSTGTIDVSANQTFTVAAVVANSFGSFGTLVKTGAGTLALTHPANTYTGGTVVRAGLVLAAVDGNLGAAAAPVAVIAAGRLTYTGSTTTARTFNLTGGTLEAASGVTLTLNGAEVYGGFLRSSGSGNIAVGANGATLSGTTVFNGTTLNQTGGNLDAINLTFGGTHAVGAGRTFSLSGANYTAGSQLNVAGIANVADFTGVGRVNVTAAGVLANTGFSDLVFGGGSVTNVGAYNPSTGQVTPGGTINIGSRNIVVQGGLLRNNGTITGTGLLVVDFGGVARGTGDYDTGGTVVRNGGVLLAGNSPGLQRNSNLSLVGGTTTGGDLNNATGTVGGFPAPANGNTNNSGWSAFEYGNSANTASGLTLQRGAGGPVNWRFRTTLNDGIGDTPGAPANFSAANSYSWLIFRPRTDASAAAPNPTLPANQLNTVATITLLDQMGNGLPNTNANLNFVLGFDRSQFVDPATGNPILASAGTFSFVFGPDLIGRPGTAIFLNFTPVPEPGFMLAAGAGLLALVGAARRRRGLANMPGGT